MPSKAFAMDVLFGQIQPELLRQNLLGKEKSGQPGRRVMPEETVYPLGTKEVSEAAYLHAARGLPEARLYTEDDLRQRYRHLKDSLYAKRNGGILRLPAEYALEVLRYENGMPVCRQEHLLDWRARTLALGQDLFTCAGQALRDLHDSCITREFLWPAVVDTDHLELQRMLAKGLSENHFHLNGSTQMFALAWGYLMNFPENASVYFQDMNFQENLNSGLSYGVRDNRLTWRQRIYEAAWIRARLFDKIRKGEGQAAGRDLWDFKKFALSSNKKGQIRPLVKALRMESQARFPQRQGKKRCLDYAISDMVEDRQLQSPHRLLAGERRLLYACFRMAFDGALEPTVCDLFYLYLLIKLRFREELIQANGRLGFGNFARYENRKGLTWDAREDYWNESYRLSVASGLAAPEDGNPRNKCIELRITPGNTPRALKQKILDTDLNILYACGGAPLPKAGMEYGAAVASQNEAYLEGIDNFFYVIHFIKQPAERLADGGRRPGNRMARPRNDPVRRRVEQQAKAMAAALEKSSYLCSRIRGIDAANHEIGCRPEVFATAFRYLRRHSPSVWHSQMPGKSRYWPQLGITYHAGEDCLDLADGMRAIDEAVCFLHLERGDRIGHAVALGLKPEVYYTAKNAQVFLPAQDLLDNLVWLLFRSLEWDVEMPDSLRVKLQNRVAQLLQEIYGKRMQSLPLGAGAKPLGAEWYYQSWKLRGDDPTLYADAVVDCDAFEQRLMQLSIGKRTRVEQYACAKMDSPYGWMEQETDRDSEAVRLRRELRGYLYLYHYDETVRRAGEQIKAFPVSRAYQTLIENMQRRMMQKIMAQGIAIECNPSSNQLIAIYGGYSNHPIFRFNSYGLPLPRGAERQQLRVSVNTDDQGVFDTSIENEYALLYSVLQEFQDAEGAQLIDNDTIRTYLDHLREMGNNMVFPKACKRMQRRHYSDRADGRGTMAREDGWPNAQEV